MNPISYYNQPQYRYYSQPYYSDNAGNYNGYPYYERNNESGAGQAAKTLGLAALLQAFSSLLQKGSNYLSNKLIAGKEFTNASNVSKVADSMIRNNKLNVEVGYIDSFNKQNYASRFGLGRELDAVAKGQNAFYADNLKLAVAPKSKPSLILHELGHAVNAKKGFTKLLQKSRRYAGYAPMALLVANGILGNSQDGKKNFVERNAGILGFCAFLPTIVEEAIASSRGIKAAKKVLNNPATLKILKKNYALALGTYILAGIGLGVASKQSIILDGKQQ